MSAKRIDIRGFGAVEDGSFEAHALGALLGMAVGDALGTTYEFARIEQPDYPTLATGPATDIVGAGPFALKAGQITDDTQMAVCLARSLAEQRRVHVDDLARRYVAWYQHAFDVGNQTAGALGRIESGSSVMTAGRETWHGSGRRAAGNGSLMRTTPIGVFTARGTLDAIVEASVVDSVITHADPRCAIACAAFNAAIAQGLAKAGAAAQLAAARAAVPIAAARLRQLFGDDREDLIAIERAEVDIVDDLQTAETATPEVNRVDLDLRRTAGFVRVAFRLAFWHLTHTKTYYDAVVDTASRGGDADTNAAIVGALLGSRDGVGAIPATWIDRVLAAVQPGPDDWAEAHHPKHLLALVQLAAQ